MSFESCNYPGEFLKYDKDINIVMKEQFNAENEDVKWKQLASWSFEPISTGKYSDLEGTEFMFNEPIRLALVRVKGTG